MAKPARAKPAAVQEPHADGTAIAQPKPTRSRKVAPVVAEAPVRQTPVADEPLPPDVVRLAVAPPAKPKVIRAKPVGPKSSKPKSSKLKVSAPTDAAALTEAVSFTPKPSTPEQMAGSEAAPVRPALQRAIVEPVPPEPPVEANVEPVPRPATPEAQTATAPASQPAVAEPVQPKQAAAQSAAIDTSLMAYLVRDPEAFARNMARLIENAGKVAAAYLLPRETGVRRDSTEELTTVFKTLANVSEYWLAEPSRAFDAQTRLWTGYMDIWNTTLKRMSGEPVEPAIKPDPRDKRFQDPEWSQNQFFDFIKQMYLMTTRWADAMVVEAEGLDEHTRLKAEFYVKQIADAIAPSNFVMTNPELLRETLANNGENLVRGIQMMAEDIAAGNGELKIRQTSPGNFQIGVNLATTPGKVIYENDICQIIQYAPTTTEVYKRPLLIVPPWINKFYILDLNADKSFIRWAVAQGRTVFVISWVNPDRRQAEKSFEQYMKEGILTGLDVVELATGEREVDTIGYCVGGTLLAVTLAWCAATGDDRIRSATFLTTQVDFTHAGSLLAFVDEDQIRLLEAEMKQRGYLEGTKMASSFNMLRPNDLIWPYFINNYMKGKEPFPFDLLYWNADATRMPAANHSFYLRNCYLENNLAKARMEIGGIKLDLSKVTIPIYNLAAKEDHIAPARSVFIGSGLFGGPVDYVMSGSGHIAGVINPPSKPKYQFWTGGRPVGEFDDWVKSAQETPGSWWPHWADWVAGHAPDKVPARKPGGDRLNAIEDAPGSYVKVKA